MIFTQLLDIDGDYFVYDVEGVNLFKIEEQLYSLLKSDEISISEVIPHRGNNSVSINTGYNLNSIHLNVAQVCNLSCVYCYGIDGEYGLKGKMNDKKAKESIDYLIEHSKEENELTIIFFGGEPLLNFPLVKTVVFYCLQKEKTINKKFNFGIVTNGTKFDREINSFLNEHKFSVTISFDGDQETQNKNRPFRGGQGSYDDILPKIKTFLKTRSGNAVARATITNHSDNLEVYNDNLKDIGFKKTMVEVATLSEYSKEYYNVKEISEEQKEKILINDKKAIENFFKKVKNREDIEEYKTFYLTRYLDQFINKRKKTSFCCVSRGMRGVAINGEIYPCHRFVGDFKFSLGNVKQKADKNEDLIKKLNVDFVNQHPHCSNCFAKYFCGGGGCIHNNYTKNGDVQKLDKEHCMKIHNRVRLLFSNYSKLETEDKVFISKSLNI